MTKLYTKLYLLAFCLALGVFSAFGQVPVLGINQTNNYTVNVPIQPLSPTNTGGAVPNLLYSKVTTIAGSGLFGSKDSTALTSTFEYPINTAYDKAGNLYIADGGYNQVRKLNVSTGLVTLLAGSVTGTSGFVNGQGTAARFNFPSSLAVDSLGNVFVADFSNSAIRVILPDGTVNTIAGVGVYGPNDGDAASARFSLPWGLTLDRNGNLLIADTYNNRIRKITFSYVNGVPSNVQVSTIAGTGAPGLNNGQANQATFRRPYGIVTDQNNNIYIADYGNAAVRKIVANTVSTLWIGGPQDSLVSIAIDKANDVYVSTRDNRYIKKIAQNNSVPDYVNFSGSKTGSGRTNSTDTLSKYQGLMGLNFDNSNGLIVADPANDLIRRVNVTGYQVYPRLPVGLSIDSTGTISGTPQIAQPATLYNFIAHNSAGASSNSFMIAIAVGSRTIMFNQPASVAYSNTLYSPGATSTDVVDSIIYTSSNPAVAVIQYNLVKTIGVGTTVITASQRATANYTNTTSVSQTLTVTAAPLTVTANDITRTQGTANPTFTAKYTGFVNGDDVNVLTALPTYQTVAVNNSPVGNYTITASGAAATNYNISYVPGTLTVFPIPVITINGSGNIAVGDSVLLTASPSAGYAYQWQLNGIDIAGAKISSYYAKQTGIYTISILDTNYYGTYSLGVAVTVQLVLPASNFILRVNSVTCKGSSDGVIHISAIQKLNYTATVSSNTVNSTFSFTDSLAISKLPPDNYSVCLSISGQTFSQCYQVTVTEPKDLSVYTAISKKSNSLDLQLDGGNNYNITLNNKTYSTNNSQISLPLVAGINKITVTTDKICQGYVEKTIDASDNLTPYPNPFNNVLNVNVGNLNVSNLLVEVVGMLDGKPVYKNQYTNQSGVLQLDLSSLKSGFYYINLTLDGSKSGFKIIKK